VRAVYIFGNLKLRHRIMLSANLDHVKALTIDTSDMKLSFHLVFLLDHSCYSSLHFI